MRLKNIPIDRYTKGLFDLAVTLNASSEKRLRGSITKRTDGALIGPFNILLHSTSDWNGCCGVATGPAFDMSHGRATSGPSVS